MPAIYKLRNKISKTDPIKEIKFHILEFDIQNSTKFKSLKVSSAMGKTDFELDSIKFEKSDKDALEFIANLHKEEPIDSENLKLINYFIQKEVLENKLVNAAKRRDSELFVERLKALPKLTAKEMSEIVDSRKWCGNMLLWSAEVGHLEIVKLIIEVLPDLINIRSNDGSTPILKAVVNNHFEVVKFLDENKADAFLANNAKKTAASIGFFKENGNPIKELFKKYSPYKNDAVVFNLPKGEGIEMTDSYKKLYESLSKDREVKEKFSESKEPSKSDAENHPEPEAPSKPNKLIYAKKIEATPENLEEKSKEFSEAQKNAPKAHQFLDRPVKVSNKLDLTKGKIILGPGTSLEDLQNMVQRFKK